jgi:cell division septation protein DedD
VEAEEKLQLVKKWNRDFDHLVGPMVKQLETLRTNMSNDLPKAAAHLSQVVRTLEAYANVSPGSASVPAPATPEPAADAETSSAPAPSEPTP